jgi:hypothetical protein
LVAAGWFALGWLSGIDWPISAQAFWAPRWALRLLVGAVLVATALLVLALLGVGFSLVPVGLAAAALLAAAIRLLHVLASRRGSGRARPRAQAVAQSTPLALEPLEQAGWVALGVILAAAVVRALLVPESGWDAYSHWGLRAQAFAAAGTIVDAGSEHDYYPPLIPLLEAWLYGHRGITSIDLGKTISALLGSAFAICLGWHLRLNLAQPWQAPYFAAGIILATPELFEGFWTGQADLALTAYLTLATLAVWQWLQTPDPRWLVIGAVFAAAAALTKFEGLPRLAVTLLVVLVYGRRRAIAPVLALGLAAAAGTLLWTAFELTHAITPNAEHLGQLQALAIGTVIATLGAVFAGIRTGGALLVAVLGWLVSWERLPGLLVLIVLGQLAATFVAFLLADTSPEIAVRTAATRLFEQFLPLALVAAAVGLSSLTVTYNRPGR